MRVSVRRIEPCRFLRYFTMKKKAPKIVLIWCLVILRLCWTWIYRCVLPFTCIDHETPADQMIFSYQLYAHFVPAEGLISGFCLFICIRQWVAVLRHEGVRTKAELLFVVLPSLVAALYSLYWLSVLYPNAIDGQYRFISVLLHNARLRF